MSDDNKTNQYGMISDDEGMYKEAEIHGDMVDGESWQAGACGCMGNTRRAMAHAAREGETYSNPQSNIGKTITLSGTWNPVYEKPGGINFIGSYSTGDKVVITAYAEAGCYENWYKVTNAKHTGYMGAWLLGLPESSYNDPGHPPGTNLLKNGSFEEGESHWTLFLASVEEDEFGHTGGPHSLHFVNRVGSFVHYAYQEVALQPGGSYLLTYYASRYGTYAVPVCPGYEYLDSNNVWSKVLGDPKLEKTCFGEFVRLDFSFTLPAAHLQKVRIRFEADCVGGVAGRAYIDDVKLIQTGGGVTPPDPSLKYVRLTHNDVRVLNADGSQARPARWPINRIVLVKDKTPTYYECRYHGDPSMVAMDVCEDIHDPVDYSIIDRMKRIVEPEIGRTNPAYFDNASGNYCQSFVEWLAMAAWLPENRLPIQSKTANAIIRFINDLGGLGTAFAFVHAKWKERFARKYSGEIMGGLSYEITDAEDAYEPRVGDFIYLLWQGTVESENAQQKPDNEKTVVSHVDFIYKIEGNTLHVVGGNRMEDGVVGKTTYGKKHAEIVGFARPNYTT